MEVDYLSDTGAEVAKATKDRDEFIRSKRGRHGKETTKIIKEFDQKLKHDLDNINSTNIKQMIPI